MSPSRRQRRRRLRRRSAAPSAAASARAAASAASAALYRRPPAVVSIQSALALDRQLERTPSRDSCGGGYCSCVVTLPYMTSPNLQQARCYG